MQRSTNLLIVILVILVAVYYFLFLKSNPNSKPTENEQTKIASALCTKKCMNVPNQYFSCYEKCLTFSLIDKSNLAQVQPKR